MNDTEVYPALEDLFALGNAGALVLLVHDVDEHILVDRVHERLPFTPRRVGGHVHAVPDLEL
jgi:hypothetical protein